MLRAKDIGFLAFLAPLFRSQGLVINEHPRRHVGMECWKRIGVIRVLRMSYKVPCFEERFLVFCEWHTGPAIPVRSLRGLKKRFHIDLYGTLVVALLHHFGESFNYNVAPTFQSNQSQASSSQRKSLTIWTLQLLVLQASAATGVSF